MAKLPTEPYRGTRDFLPDEMSVRSQIFQTLYRTVETFGFTRYDGPTLEPAQIYEVKSGDEIANNQLYRLTDKGGRDLALRPEMTPTVARIVAANAGNLTLPARWYSHPNCFRYEKPQRGRVREHWQLNVDMFGSESIEAEVEIFELTAAIMEALGATREMYVLRVNDRVLVEGALANYAGVPEDKRIGASMVMDRWEKSTDEERQKAVAELGLDDRAGARIGELVAMDLDAYAEAAGKEASEKSRVARIVRGKLADAPIKFDPLIIRAFNYYTSTVFEVFDVSPDNRRSIFGGGRYDDLASLFTNKRIPGIGFGMGDVTTWNFLEAHGLLPKADVSPRAYVFATAEAHQPIARSICRALRREGVRTTIGLDTSGIKNGLSRASKVGARVAIALADAEVAAGKALIKDLSKGEQSAVDIAAAAAHVKTLLG